MPRIRAELADQGIVASCKRIASVMTLASIRGVSRRRGYVVTTTRDKRQRPAPDLVKRQFVATDVNQLWVAAMLMTTPLSLKSFIATLECELIDRLTWKTHTEARSAIFTGELRLGTTRTDVTLVLLKYHRLTLKG